MPLPWISTKNEPADASINLNDIKADFVDTAKIAAGRSDYLRDLRNYVLFQKMPTFRWPLWLTGLADPASEYHRPIVPAFLSNTAGTDAIAFSNILSSDDLLVDLAGMLSPTYATWSMEVWMIADGALIRPQERPGRVSMERIPRRGMVKAVWDESAFRVTTELFGIRTDIDEAVIDIACSVKKSVQTAVLCVAFRPYNGSTLGGIEAIEYQGDTRIVRINGRERALVGAKPDAVAAGSFDAGDIDAASAAGGEHKARCRYGMATLGLFYRLSRGENALTVRLSLARDRALRPAKLDFKKLREDFSAFANQRANAGVSIAIGDRGIEQWFLASKLSLLSHLNNGSLFPGKSMPDVAQARLLYYVLAAYVRMGAFAETLMVLEAFLGSLSLGERPGFHDIVVACYFLCAAGDYFIVSRNMDHLKTVFAAIRAVAVPVLAHAAGIKEKQVRSADAVNTIPYSFLRHAHLHDIFLAACACRQFAYLARCMGLFGDELKFAKESQRLEEIALREIAQRFPAPRAGKKDDAAARRAAIASEDETLIYCLFAGFPFGLTLLSPEKLRTMTDALVERYGGVPLYLRSRGGWDSFLSLALAHNLIALKDARAFDIITHFFDAGGKRFSVPDVINPKSRHGVFGEGDSRLAHAVLFLALRNLLFVDAENRLEIFPLPREEWFTPGSEIVIRDAPSRFGLINLRAVSTPNEIQVHFEQLPQFLPHDMLITLPVKTKLVKEDDFIIKKELGNAYLISGWPTIVRFLRQ